METELEGRVREAFFYEHANPLKQQRALEILDTLKEYHFPTYEHSLRVGLKAKEIAKFLHHESKPVLYGGILHDIGKVEIPIEILEKSEVYDKENPYTPEDHDLMKRHTGVGYAILMEEGFFRSAWIALTHHHFQKNSYPETLPPFPTQLVSIKAHVTANLYSRIVSIADQWDASSRRNNLHISQQLTPEKIKDNLIQGNLDWVSSIEDLYHAGILA